MKKKPTNFIPLKNDEIEDSLKSLKLVAPGRLEAVVRKEEEEVEETAISGFQSGFNSLVDDDEATEKITSHFLYIFALSESTYILYRINLFDNKFCNIYHPSSSSMHHHDLLPILIFPKSVMSGQWSCAKIDSNIYFVGNDNEKDFFTIHEDSLASIVPSDTNIVNLHGELMTKHISYLPPMNEYKLSLLLFVANSKLYLFSKNSHCLDRIQFEVFDPKDNSWDILPPQPMNSASVISHLLVEDWDIVYFVTLYHSVISFHLLNRVWKIVRLPDNDIIPAYFRSTPQPQLIGDKMFGFLDHLWTHFSTIVGSTFFPSPSDGCPSADFNLLRPTLAPQPNLIAALDSAQAVMIKDYTSEHIVALDRERMMCVISLGAGPPNPSPEVQTDLYFDLFSSYVTLSFFRVDKGLTTSVITADEHCTTFHDDIDQQKDLPSFYFADTMIGDQMYRQSFSAELIHTVRFDTMTQCPIAPGLVTCLCDLFP